MSTLNELYQAAIAGTANEQQLAELRNLLAQPEMESNSLRLIRNAIEQGYSLPGGMNDEKLMQIQQAILAAGTATTGYETPNAPAYHRVHFLRTAWFRYAAIVITLITALAVYYQVSNTSEESKIIRSTAANTLHVPPGYNRAVLTLSNGKQVELDSAASEIITDGQLAIKNENGKLVYRSSDIVALNTMATPKGGQYQLALPDGTKVWLNAASSITYPTSFPGSSREVTVQGEVYFEVAKNQRKPFVVNVNGKSLVEVLGTQFNVNAYGDRGTIRTTLIDGSVKVNRQVVLKPGQETIQSTTAPAAAAAETGAGLTVVNADIEKVLAWKNGLFSFNDDDIYTVMKQLERWYDIDVKFEGRVRDITFKGKMYRNLNLSDVLEALATMGVKFRMEGKTVVVF
jgi:transmembrane sensor